MFDRKIQKNCGSLRVTTSEFVLSVSKSIDSYKLKVDPEWGQRNWTIIGHRIRPSSSSFLWIYIFLLWIYIFVLMNLYLRSSSSFLWNISSFFFVLMKLYLRSSSSFLWIYIFVLLLRSYETISSFFFFVLMKLYLRSSSSFLWIYIFVLLLRSYESISSFFFFVLMNLYLRSSSSFL
jgi:hypothetical protein